MKKNRCFPWLSLSLVLTCLTTLQVPTPSQAAIDPPRLAQTNPPPQEVQAFLTQLDAAASQRNLEAVLKFYRSDFSNTDGLNRQTLEKVLSEFWKKYPTLTYRTELNAWQATNNGFTLDTTTTITGQGKNGARPLVLKAVLKTRQQVVDKQILSQEILAETTQITAGETPPTVQVNLPDQVKVGQDYNLDVIVQEPLGDSLLLGAAMEKPVAVDAYAKPVPVDLSLLSAGGLFKLGKAPAQPGDQWISVALIRDNGMTLITHRLRVVKP